MGYPRFYRAFTQDAEHPEQQMFYYTKYPEHEEACSVAPGGTTIPCEELETECNQIQHAVVNISIRSQGPYLSKWDKLPLEVIDVRELGFKSAYARLSLHYALDKELRQLFDFLHFEERLRHSNDMARLQKLIDKDLKIMDEQQATIGQLLEKVQYLELPWYKKLWIFLTSTQEF